ncbi:MAG: hypothetical protein KIH63_002990 [Candidatus Saccharibacteria bacterium]|nr:hypothetical protein [Candidatus Saccharibacteria bacterium]
MTQPQQTPEFPVIHQTPVMEQVAFGNLPALSEPHVYHEAQTIMASGVSHEGQSGASVQSLVGVVAVVGLGAYAVHRRMNKRKAAKSAASEGSEQKPARNYWAPPKADTVNQPHKPVELQRLSDDDPTMWL